MMGSEGGSRGDEETGLYVMERPSNIGAEVSDGNGWGKDAPSKNHW